MDCIFCAIANGGFCGGGFHSSLSASLDDGLMDAYLIHKISKPKFLTLLPGYRTGKYIYAKAAQNCVEHFKCKKIHIKAQEEFKLCNDGEIFNEKELDISIEEDVELVTRYSFLGPIPIITFLVFLFFDF